MAKTRADIEAEMMVKFEQAATIAAKQGITVREALHEVEKVENVKKKEAQGITPLTPEIIQSIKDEGVECLVFGEDTATPSLNCFLVPGAKHASQLARNGELNKLSVKVRLMETILTCQKVAKALSIDLGPEKQD